MLQDTARVARDTVADSTVVAGHHLSGWWIVVAVAVVALAVGVFLWHQSRPIVVDNSRR